MFRQAEKWLHSVRRLSLVGFIALAGLAMISISAGCGDVSSSPVDPPEVDSGGSGGSGGSDGGAVVANGDDLDLARVTNFFIPSTPGVTPDEVRNAKVTAKITAASTNGDLLYTSFDPQTFPIKDGAVAYFFYVSGNTVMGGKFDWWREGGQPVKTLANVHEGYGGHRMPARGTECWTMFGSKDGSQRSNTRKVEWR